MTAQWFPPLDLPTLIEIGHRWAAALVSLFVFAVALVAWRRHRAEPALRGPATLAAVLLVVQVLLGAITVKLALPPWIIIVHLANAMVLLATLLVVALRAGERRAGAAAPARRAAPAAPSGAGNRGLGFVVILFGAQVANFHAGLLCLGFPLCNGADPSAGRALGALALDPPGLRLRLPGGERLPGGSGSPGAATLPAGHWGAGRRSCWPSPWLRSALPRPWC